MFSGVFGEDSGANKENLRNMQRSDVSIPLVAPLTPEKKKKSNSSSVPNSPERREALRGDPLRARVSVDNIR